MMTQEEFFKRYSYTPSKDRIGGGGFGTVYKAKDNLLHRIVAIKVSEVKTTADGQKTFSLKDEFEALDHVPKHPNIANYEEFYSFEMPNGIFDYAVMQYYPDGNLSNAIKEGLTDAQKEDIASQLLEGIAFLHQHKVVHRDLKPGNILIVRDGDKVIPLITDFGLSKAASTGDGSVFTNSFGGGTPRYSSPEQLQGQPLRFNTDLWSFGAILYEVFTGQQLFSPGSGASNTAQADLEIFNKIVHGDVQSLGKMPEKWRKVAERCLVVDPEKRTKSAEELRALLCEDEEETEVTMGAAGGAASGNPKEKASEPVKGQKSSSQKAEKPSASAKAEKLVSSPKAEKPVSAPAKEAVLEGGKSKKGLWIALAAVAAAIVLAVLLLRPSSQGGNGSANGHAYVDLGLPSGTLWATCNMGASKPEGYGHYYAWGETKPQSSNAYNWDSYKYANGSYFKLTKYCSNSDYGDNGFTDNQTTLQTDDDPATSWGSGWRTPSEAQWDELLANTTNKWTTQNGVKGRLFTAKNGQTLFLPAAGGRWGSGLGNVGSGGYYWSGSLDTVRPDYAWGLDFDSDVCYMDYDGRYCGFSVRPVRQN